MRSRRIAVDGLVLTLAATGRLAVSARGSNFDLQSYNIIADIAADGGNVYADTSRYNYGPVWFLVLGVIESFAQGPSAWFRFAVILVVFSAELAIWAMLRHVHGRGVAAAFLLNPVSIIITGYHNQFDAIAIALGLAAVLVARGPDSSSARFSAALALLGASLATKHVLFLFPLWFALSQTSWRRRAAALLVPPLVFAASFLPYYAEGSQGIQDNVINYRSAANAPLMDVLLPNAVESQVLATTCWLAALITAGWLFRRRPLVEQLLWYTIVLVAFAPAIANQYLAIPVAAAVVLLNPAFVLFFALVTLLLVLHPDGLRLEGLAQALPSAFGDYRLVIPVLAVGLVWAAYCRRTELGGVPDDAAQSRAHDARGC